MGYNSGNLEHEPVHIGQHRYISRLTRDTLALVMAGGRGSRLGPLTDWRAKPAVPFGGKYRIIDFTLSNCINSGIRRVGVLTQYRSQSLTRHIQQGWGFLRGEFSEFVEVLPAQQRGEDQSWYRGTADAVYQNLDVIKASGARYTLVLAGDHIYKMDYGAMLAHHVESSAQVTVGCVEVPIGEAHAFGVMQIDTNARITSFTEKPAAPESLPGRPDTALASMGIYVFDTLYLQERLRRDASSSDSRHDFGRDIIPAAIAAERVQAHALRDPHDPTRAGYWRDVGTIDAYWSANLELASVVPELDLYDQRWPIWSSQGQVPPAKFMVDPSGQNGTAQDSLVSGGCIISGAAVQRSVLFSGARIERASLVEDTVILPGARIGPRCRIRRAIIEENCTIPEGTIIGGDPRADRGRFYLTESGVSLITPEMIGQVSQG